MTMGTLTLFDLFPVGAMLIFYALEERSPWFVLAFAVSCVMASPTASGRTAKLCNGAC